MKNLSLSAFAYSLSQAAPTIKLKEPSYSEPLSAPEKRVDEEGNPYLHVPIRAQRTGMRLHRDLIGKRSELEQLYGKWDEKNLSPDIPQHEITNKEFKIFKETTKHKLGATKATVSLDMFENVMWTGKLYMGSNA